MQTVFVLFCSWTQTWTCSSASLSMKFGDARKWTGNWVRKCFLLHSVSGNNPAVIGWSPKDVQGCNRKGTSWRLEKYIIIVVPSRESGMRSCSLISPQNIIKSGQTSDLLLGTTVQRNRKNNCQGSFHSNLPAAPSQHTGVLICSHWKDCLRFHPGFFPK